MKAAAGPSRHGRTKPFPRLSKQMEIAMRSRKELADAVRILSMDAVDKAKSGHPGAPMGMADMAEALWRGVLRHNPANPH